MKEASFHNVIALKGILSCFELIFGLKINFHKSKLSGGVEDVRMGRFASLL